MSFSTALGVESDYWAAVGDVDRYGSRPGGLGIYRYSCALQMARAVSRKGHQLWFAASHEKPSKRQGGTFNGNRSRRGCCGSLSQTPVSEPRAAAKVLRQGSRGRRREERRRRYVGDLGRPVPTCLFRHVSL